MRLFRNRPEHRYRGIIHEQITPSIADRLGVADLEVTSSGLTVGHDGYRQSRREHAAKAARNVEMLAREIRRDGRNAAPRYFLARELLPFRNGRVVPGTHVREALGYLEWISEHREILAVPLEVDASRLHAAALLAERRVAEARQVLDLCPDRGVACELLRADAEAFGAADQAATLRALERIERCFDRETRHLGPVSEPALSGPIARVHAAERLLDLGRLEHAAAMAEEASRMPGGGAAPWNALATIEKRRNRRAGALRAYLQGIQVDPLDPWVWLGMGETVLEGGDPAQAVESLRHAATLAPGWNQADEALAATWLMSGEVDAIAEFFSRRERAAGTGARAARLLCGIAGGASTSPTTIERPVQESMRRILDRLAPDDSVNRMSRV